VLLARAPSRVRPRLAKLLSRSITGLAAASPPGTRFAVHLCLGGMNNRAFGIMGDVSPLVLLANAITSSWPAERRLELIHAPFAAADNPATTTARFYEPLTELHLPTDVRFAAGFVHETQELSQQREIRDLIESRLAREVMVSAACGLGRRDEPAARANLERTAELCAN
jgi:methionine synthase II (cobalamin-independent)